MRHNFQVKEKGIRIRPLQHDDIEALRTWRNDQELSIYLRPIGIITAEMQEMWYQNYLNDDNIITFAIEKTEPVNELAGSVSIYDFKGSEATSGKVMIGNKNTRGMGMGVKGEALAMHVGFQKLGIESYLRDVIRENKASLRAAEKLGFNKIGERKSEDSDRIEFMFRITKEEFYEKNPHLLECVMRR